MEPGARTIYDGLPALRAADGLLLLEEVQPAGKKAMPGRSFLLGARSWANS
jgi:methionyl-tRNA formyltransferase